MEILETEFKFFKLVKCLQIDRYLHICPYIKSLSVPPFFSPFLSLQPTCLLMITQIPTSVTQCCVWWYILFAYVIPKFRFKNWLKICRCSNIALGTFHAIKNCVRMMGNLNNDHWKYGVWELVLNFVDGRYILAFKTKFSETTNTALFILLSVLLALLLSIILKF